jgi:hypothetical protein
MARPLKPGLNYFPLDVSFDDDVELLEAECGLEGFAIMIKLWQKIYSNGYYMDWNEDTALLFSKKINSEKDKVNSVVNACLHRNLFNKLMYKAFKILTSAGIQKRYLIACSSSKRKNIVMEERFLLINDKYKQLITELTQFTPEETDVKPGESTQRKGKERKGKESNIYSDFLSSFEASEELKKILNEFIKYRQSMKKPLKTEHAFNLIINKLNKWGKSDSEKIAILNQSIESGWTGIYEIKQQKQQSKPQQANFTQRERSDEFYQNLYENVR